MPGIPVYQVTRGLSLSAPWSGLVTAAASSPSPSHQEASKGSNEAFFGDLPRTPKLLFINALVTERIEIHSSSTHKTESVNKSKM